MATTWSIEYIPAGGGASTFASLDVWGFASLQMRFSNWGGEQASITTRGGSIAFEAAQFSYLDKLVVWRNGVRHSHWWVIGPALNAESRESRTYTLAGPSWWLESTPFAHPQHVVDITTDPGTGAATGCTWEMLHGTEVVWTSWAAQSSGTILGQLNRALWCAVDNDAPIVIGTIDMPGLAAAANASGTCMSVMQQAARLLPRSACWWDSSGEVPQFRASSRAGLSTTTLAIGTDEIEAIGLQPRADRRVDVVRVVYTYPNGDSTAAWFDTAGDTTLKDGPNTLRATIECSTSAIASNAASHFGIADQLYNALSETPWEGSVILHDTGAGLPDVPLGAKLCLSGGRSEWQAMYASIEEIALTISPAVNDVLTVTIGPPPALGAQDIFEALNMLLAAGTGAVDTNGGTTDPTPDPGDDDPTPGTYDDLNGTTGGGAPIGSITAQARGGNWSLIGYPENNMGEGTATLPPPRYRRLTRGGSARTDYFPWGDSDCGSPNGWYKTITWAGTCQHDPATGVLSGAATETRRAEDGTITEVSLGCVYGAGYGGGFAPVSHTRAETTEVPCHYIDGVPYGSHSRTTGIGYVDLSDPDTADAAISRLLATAPEWTTGLTAIRTVPTTGITGVYREARYRTEHTEGTGESAVTYPTLEGLEPWQRYRVTVMLESRPVDSAGAPTGEYVADGTRTHYFVANLDGEGGIDWQIIEPTAGYETRIASTLVEAA